MIISHDLIIHEFRLLDRKDSVIDSISMIIPIIADSEKESIQKRIDIQLNISQSLGHSN